MRYWTRFKMLNKSYGKIVGKINYNGKTFPKIEVNIGKSQYHSGDSAQVLVSTDTLLDEIEEANPDWDTGEDSKEVEIHTEISYFLEKEKIPLLIEPFPDLLALREIIREIYDDETAELYGEWNDALKTLPKREEYQDNVDEGLI